MPSALRATLQRTAAECASHARSRAPARSATWPRQAGSRSRAHSANAARLHLGVARRVAHRALVLFATLALARARLLLYLVAVVVRVRLLRELRGYLRSACVALQSCKRVALPSSSRRLGVCKLCMSAAFAKLVHDGAECMRLGTTLARTGCHPAAGIRIEVVDAATRAAARQQGVPPSGDGPQRASRAGRRCFYVACPKA